MKGTGSMSLSKRLNVALVATLSFLLLGMVALATPASSAPSDYFAQIAKALQANPVYVDAKASPSISSDQANQLSSQIKNTRKGIFMILVDDSQVGSTAAQQLPDAIHAVHGKSGVYAVNSKGGFFAQGFSVPAPIAEQAGKIATQALSDSKQANGGKPVPVDVFSRFVKGVDSVKVPTGNNSSSGSTSSSGAGKSTAQKKSGMGAGKVILIIFGVLILLGIIIGALVYVSKQKRRREEDTRLARRLKTNIGNLETELLNLDSEVQLNPDAKGAHSKAFTHASSASSLLESNDLDGAQAEYDRAVRACQEAKNIINPPPPPPPPAPRRPRTSRRAAAVMESDYEPETSGVRRGPIRARTSDGTTVVINNDVSPRQQQGGGYDHFHRGGYVPGLGYMPMGYYPYSLVDLMVMDAVLDGHGHHGDRDYRDGYRDGRDDDHREDSSERETGDAGGGSWGDSGGSDDSVEVGASGGSSWGDSGSSDPGSSDSGGSWGGSGGSDSGGGGFDSGGGGDSGGGSW